mmetsp:Transcript_54427/g.90174  ORF Transcript_54427/g.90174 Transcript_54427/m.90174 type:complete len:247 (-) Transcript_54427:773-1513(-)
MECALSPRPRLVASSLSDSRILARINSLSLTRRLFSCTFSRSIELSRMSSWRSSCLVAVSSISTALPLLLSASSSSSTSTNMFSNCSCNDALLGRWLSHCCSTCEVRRNLCRLSAICTFRFVTSLMKLDDKIAFACNANADGRLCKLRSNLVRIADFNAASSCGVGSSIALCSFIKNANCAKYCCVDSCSCRTFAVSANRCSSCSTRACACCSSWSWSRWSMAAVAVGAGPPTKSDMNLGDTNGMT